MFARYTQISFESLNDLDLAKQIIIENISFILVNILFFQSMNRMIEHERHINRILFLIVNYLPESFEKSSSSLQDVFVSFVGFFLTAYYVIFSSNMKSILLNVLICRV